MKKLFFISIVIAVLVFPLAGRSEDSPVAGEAPPTEIGIGLQGGVVTDVIDAGTVKIDGTTMRLLGVWAPRRWWWGPSRDCYSIVGSKYLEDWILGKEVAYTIDPAFGDIRNGYRRIYLYFEGRQINAELLAKGLVLTDRTKDYIEKERFTGIEANAKLRDLGLWHTCVVECEWNDVCRTKNW